MNAQIAEIKANEPNYSAFLEAGKLLSTMKGFSISGDGETLKLIKKKLDFTPKTEGGGLLKSGMLRRATKKASEGMGGGMFLID